MDKKIYLLLIILFTSLSIIPFSSPTNYESVQYLGKFEVDASISLVIGCTNASYLNLSRIEYQKNSSLIINQETSTTEIGSSNIFNYTLSPRKDIGIYVVYGHCDLNGVSTPFEGYFEVTPSGEEVSIYGMIIPAILLLCGTVCLVVFFAFKNAHWQWRTFFIFLSIGMGLLALNAAKVFVDSSTSLNLITNVGIIVMIVLLVLIVVYFLVYSTIEIFKVIKAKRGVRWNY